MAASNIPEEVSLWQEGFLMFGRHWRAWIGEGVWFFFVLALLNLLLVIDSHALGIAAVTDPHANLTQADAERMAPIILGGALGGIIVNLVQTYVFSVFFLKREPIVKTPKPGWLSFFCFCGVCLQIILLIMGIAAGAIFLIVIAHLAKHVITPNGVDAATLVVELSAFGLIYYVLIKIVPSFTFAASGIRSPLMASWRIMEGNWWRFFGNSIVTMLLVMIPLLIIMSAAAQLGHMMSSDKPGGYLPAGILMSGVNALLQVLFTGVYTAFSCSTCRILYKERRKADPSFDLTMTT